MTALSFPLSPEPTTVGGGGSGKQGQYSTQKEAKRSTAWLGQNISLTFRCVYRLLLSPRRNITAAVPAAAGC